MSAKTGQGEPILLEDNVIPKPDKCSGPTGETPVCECPYCPIHAPAHHAKRMRELLDDRGYCIPDKGEA